MNIAEKTPFNGFLLLSLLLLCLVSGGCASSNLHPEGPMPKESFLPRVKVDSGSSVLVSVEGDDKEYCKDLASLISSALQSDRKLDLADTPQTADLFVDVTVKDVYLGATKKGAMKASNTLGNTLFGTLAGAAVGSLAGGRTGALIGAGVGGVLGVGASAIDAKSRNVWVMTSEVSISKKGERVNPIEHAVTAEGDGMEKTASGPALKERLAQDIVSAIKIK